MNGIFPRFVGGPGSMGLLFLRLAAGSAMILHGWPKIQSPTGWMGDAVPGFLQAASAVAEFGGGISWIVGLLTPLFSLLLLGNMTFAVAMVHVKSHHPFVGSPQMPAGETAEAAVLYLAIALLLLLAGPGTLSFDYLLFRRRLPAGSASGSVSSLPPP
jgi:putative oxidoreductase